MGEAEARKGRLASLAASPVERVRLSYAYLESAYHFAPSDKEKAFEAAKESFLFNTGNIEAFNVLKGYAGDLNRSHEIIDILEEILSAHPDDVEAIVLLDAELREAGREDEAFDRLLDASKRNPESPLILIVLAEHLEEIGERDAAIEKLVTARRIIFALSEEDLENSMYKVRLLTLANSALAEMTVHNWTQDRWRSFSATLEPERD